MLNIDKLNFSYGDLKVLWDIDLAVNQGEIVTSAQRTAMWNMRERVSQSGMPPERYRDQLISIRCPDP